MERNLPISKRVKESVTSTATGAVLILYGSYARGDNDKDSDVDVLVLIDHESVSYEEEKRIEYPLYHIEYETGIFVSPIVLSKKVWETRHRITPFYQNILKEGVVL